MSTEILKAMSEPCVSRYDVSPRGEVDLEVCEWSSEVGRADRHHGALRGRQVHTAQYPDGIQVRALYLVTTTRYNSHDSTLTNQPLGGGCVLQVIRHGGVHHYQRPREKSESVP
uniref:Uncharacterized protein n=1 Tax=Timema bartmani TaxID=61472 RepID=A0A7R9HX86_9NEOP|nr:unnamed protein product [Timema bartmani]